MLYFTYKKGQVYTLCYKKGVGCAEKNIPQLHITHIPHSQRSTYIIPHISFYTKNTQQKCCICYSHYNTALHTYYIYLTPNKARNLRVIGAKKRVTLLLLAFVLLVKSVFISIVSNSSIHFSFTSFHIL